jgi:hypothetical protein
VLGVTSKIIFSVNNVLMQNDFQNALQCKFNIFFNVLQCAEVYYIQIHVLMFTNFEATMCSDVNAKQFAKQKCAEAQIQNNFQPGNMITIIFKKYLFV